VAYLILLSSPAIPGDSIIDFQVMSTARRHGASENDLRRILDLQHRTYRAAREGTGFDSLEILLVEEGHRSLSSLPEESRRAMGSPDSLIRSRVAQQMSALQSSWFKEFISYDPADALERVNCPVLALFGEVDQQVPPSLNRSPMEKAFNQGGNQRVAIRTLPKANHLFLQSDTGDPGEYGSMKKEFVPGFLEEMSSWLEKESRP
jgi:pimeloyl-ACP methyl ester carboxylesterase